MRRIIGLLCSALFIASALFAEAPNTFLYDGTKLAKIKEQRMMPAYKSAVDKVIAEAKKELKRKPASVMEKKMIAPSGDKHDYVSMGPYWWPDPSKSDGLPYIRKDGQRNPELDKLDRNRMGNTIKAITNLCYGYYFSGDEVYAEKAMELMRIWFLDKKTKMNPNLDYGQMIPGHNNGLGRGEGIIDVYCFIDMLDGLELLEGSKAYSSKDKKGMKAWFTDFVAWLQKSRVGQDECNAKNNHGVAYDVQLTRYAFFVGDNELAKKLLTEFPQKRIFPQIEPDGRQPLELVRTIAFSYTLFNIKHMLDMCELGKKMNIDVFNACSEDGRSIRKALAFMIPYIGKTKEEWPYQQIKEWDQKQEEATWILRRASFFAPDEKYEEIGATFRKSAANHRNHILFSL